MNVHEYLPNDIKIREADGVKAILQKVNDFWQILYIWFVSELDTIQHRRCSQRFVSECLLGSWLHALVVSSIVLFTRKFGYHFYRLRAQAALLCV